MTFRKILVAFVFFVVGVSGLLARSEKPIMDAKTNERMIQDITDYTLLTMHNVIIEMDEKYLEECAQYQRQLQKYGNNSGEGGYGHGIAAMDPIEPTKKDEKEVENIPEPKEPEFADYVKVCQERVQAKFGGSPSDIEGVYPLVDARGEVELREIAIQEVFQEYANFLEAGGDFGKFMREKMRELVIEEFNNAEAMYPLYLEGDVAEISFAHGNEPRHTYRGTFRPVRRNGSFKNRQKKDEEFEKEWQKMKDMVLMTMGLDEAIPGDSVKDRAEEIESRKEQIKAKLQREEAEWKRKRKPVDFFKIWIGKDMLNMNDLPEIFRARFDPQLNLQCRAEELLKHRGITKFNIEMEEKIAARQKELLQKQFNQNLLHGWVYIGGAWKRPVELVEGIIQFRLDSFQNRGEIPDFVR